MRRAGDRKAAKRRAIPRRNVVVRDARNPLRAELRAVEKDRSRGSVALAHRAIMALARASESVPEGARAALEKDWLEWAKTARPEMLVFGNLARAARGRSAAWLRKRGLAVWLLATLFNSLSATIRKAAAALPRGARVLVFGRSSTLEHALSLCRDKGLTLKAVAEPHTLRLAAVLRRQGFRVVTVDPARLDFLKGWVTHVLISCDAHHADGTLINQTGTSKIVRWADKQGIPILCVTTRLKASPHPLRPPRKAGFELVRPVPNLRLIGDL